MRLLLATFGVAVLGMLGAGVASAGGPSPCVPIPFHPCNEPPVECQPGTGINRWHPCVPIEDECNYERRIGWLSR